MCFIVLRIYFKNPGGIGGWDVKYLQQCTFHDCKLNFLGFVEKDMELEKSGADGAKAALLGIYIYR